MKPKAAGHTAVMAQRVEPPDSLEFFPTPPWAARALCEVVLRKRIGPAISGHTCWEPAAGEGHMAEVLGEYFSMVYASDVHDYGKGYQVGSFVGEGPDVARLVDHPHWIITNPPFSMAVEFLHRAIAEVRFGVALLVRSNWAEGVDRYHEVFSYRPPNVIAQFVERVPMVKGRWDPEASTATSYAWFVWHLPISRSGTRYVWIPPGQRQLLERPDDRRRFAPAPEPMTLFPTAAE